jgi:hypothetical protein
MTKNPGKKKLTDKAPLLDEGERSLCNGISKLEDIQGQRARALSAIDKGKTQAEAATETELSQGQVRYLLEKFRKERMKIFPETILFEIKKTSERVAEESFSEKKITGDPIDEELPNSKGKAKKTKKKKSSKKAGKKSKSSKKKKKSKLKKGKPGKKEKKKKGKKDKKNKKAQAKKKAKK